MSNKKSDLLVEIGTEELPPKALLNLAVALSTAFQDELAKSLIACATAEHFASPRRLAILIRDVETKQQDQETIRRGPSIKSAFLVDGSASKAAIGFARSCGVTVAELQRQTTKKGEWLCYRTIEQGRNTEALLPQLIESALTQLPIPKRMRWGTGDAEFVRPVHWVCVVFGNEGVTGSILGVPIGRRTRGHRFHHPEEITVPSAIAYAEQLRRYGRVEPSFEKRRALIEKLVTAGCEAEGLVPAIDRELLDEVTGLVEFPNIVIGEFDEGFLEVPPEVLIEAMQSHQKYFPVRSRNGDLVARFVAVTNIESLDPDAVRAGNERVIRPRFADAKFFWKQDLKVPLGDFFSKLESIVYQNRLGSMADKSRRVQRLAIHFARELQMESSSVGSAALLGKCDLVSSLVAEFPRLQGTMGRYFAEHAGLSKIISDAIEEQYLPRYAGDRIPSEPCGQLLAIADRIDTLIGIFGIGMRPTGAKDPYGLRRASISVMRILIEGRLPIDLLRSLEIAEKGFDSSTIQTGTSREVFQYMVDRLSGYYQEKGVSADTVEAVLAVGETTPLFMDQRISAVERFRDMPGAMRLAAANKRIKNILEKSADKALENMKDVSIDSRLLSLAAEVSLWQAISDLERSIADLSKRRSYTAILESTAALQGPVDTFFAEVMVNVDDQNVRKNRLAMLNRLMSMFLNVADISRLH